MAKPLTLDAYTGLASAPGDILRSIERAVAPFHRRSASSCLFNRGFLFGREASDKLGPIEHASIALLGLLCCVYCIVFSFQVPPFSTTADILAVKGLMRGRGMGSLFREHVSVTCAAWLGAMIRDRRGNGCLASPQHPADERQDDKDNGDPEQHARAFGRDTGNAAKSQKRCN